MPIPVGGVEISSAEGETEPAISADGNTLYFVRARSNSTKRNATTEPWPRPTEVTELETHDEEVLPTWISPDGCRLYMTYRPGTQNARILMATRGQ